VLQGYEEDEIAKRRKEKKREKKTKTRKKVRKVEVEREGGSEECEREIK
jgi:hypothetical protein